VGRRADSVTWVFKTRTSHSSCRNSFPISCLSAWRIDGIIDPVYFSSCCSTCFVQWPGRRKYKKTIQQRFESRTLFVEGCLLSVSSGAWQRWLCVYISVQCDGVSGLKWQKIPQRVRLRKPICCGACMRTGSMGALHAAPSMRLPACAACGADSGSNAAMLAEGTLQFGVGLSNADTITISFVEYLNDNNKEVRCF